MEDVILISTHQFEMLNAMVAILTAATIALTLTLTATILTQKI